MKVRVHLGFGATQTVYVKNRAELNRKRETIWKDRMVKIVVDQPEAYRYKTKVQGSSWNY